MGSLLGKDEDEKMRWVGRGGVIKAIRLRSWQGSFRQAMSVTITRRLGGRGRGKDGG